MYGTQTSSSTLAPGMLFENDVKMYGTQTMTPTTFWNTVFENDVKMYGTQTTGNIIPVAGGLRMM